MENSINLFEDKKVRAVWNEDEEKRYFSVIDVVGALSESSEQREMLLLKMVEQCLKIYQHPKRV